MTVRSRLLVTFLPILLLSIAAVGRVSYVYYRDTLTKDTLAQLQSVASTQVARVRAALRHRHEFLALVASRTQLRLSLSELVNTGDAAPRERISRILDDVKAAMPNFGHITLWGRDGRVLVSTDTARIGADDSASPAFIRGLQGEAVDLMARTDDGHFVSQLVSPLQLGGVELGVLLIEIRPDDLYALVGDYTGLGSTGETLLARRAANGDAEFLLPLRFDANAALQRRVPKTALNVPITRALLKENRLLTEAVNYRGRPVLGVSHYLPEPDWGLVMILETAEAYAPLRELRRVMIAITAAVSALAVVAVLLASHGLTRPLERLAYRAARISEGHWGDGNQTGSAATADSRYAEIALLNQAFNHMEQNLIERNRSLEHTLSQLKDTVQSRTQALEELKQAQELLVQQERLASLGDAVAGMVHEVNTPLGVALTAASSGIASMEKVRSTLAGEHPSRSELETHLGHCQQACELVVRNLQRASDLMRSFKTVSIDQASHAPRSFDLRAYIDDVLLNLRPHTKRSAHHINVSGPDSLKIYSVPGAFSQILTNLVMNSLKHGYGEDDSGEIDIALTVEGNTVTLIYRDDGRGIPREHQVEVFEKYFTTQREEGGSGLGLYLVRKLVEEELHGCISLRSEPGEGLEITIAFPLRRGPA